MITVWGRASSSNVQVVLWCLHELGVEYKRIDAGFTYGVTDTPEYLAMNPNGVVPTIQDGDNPPLFESCAICRYLASCYGKDDFWPRDVHQRGQVDMWAEWAKQNIAQNFSIPLFWPKVRLDPQKIDAEAIDAAAKKLDKFMAMADERLAEKTFLVGDHLTLADVIFGHSLYRYFDIDIDRADLKSLARYYQMLTAREAFRSTVMSSYDELRFKS